MALLDRLKTRLPDISLVADVVLEELLTTVQDRICLRLGVDSLPKQMESIAVDAGAKLYRKMSYEGIASESADTLNTSFVEDILAEYEAEFDSYRIKQEAGKKVVRFL